MTSLDLLVRQFFRDHFDHSDGIFVPLVESSYIGQRRFGFDGFHIGPIRLDIFKMPKFPTDQLRKHDAKIKFMNKVGGDLAIYNYMEFRTPGCIIKTLTKLEFVENEVSLIDCEVLGSEDDARRSFVMARLAK